MSARQVPDIKVGQMSDGPLLTSFSVRGGNVIVGYFNIQQQKGFEVAYSPKAVGQLIENLLVAKRVAEGQG